MVSTNGINNYKVSPIKASGLEIPLLLTFSVEQTRIHEMMKDFFGTYTIITTMLKKPITTRLMMIVTIK